MLYSIIKQIMFFSILCFLMSFEVRAMCAAGSKGGCKDVLDTLMNEPKCPNPDETKGELYCYCTADYGNVSIPPKGLSWETSTTSNCVALAGGWNQVDQSFSRLSDCNADYTKCMCQRAYEVIVLAPKIDLRSVGAKEQLKQVMAIADETCEVLSTGHVKVYRNSSCQYNGYVLPAESEGSCLVEEWIPQSSPLGCDVKRSSSATFLEEITSGKVKQSRGRSFICNI